MEDKKKIFIGNLPYSTTQEKLVEIFSQYGEITDSYKPAGKGFGFVTFATEEAALAAIEAMNGQDIDGRAAVVNIAQPKSDRPRENRGGYGGGNRGGYGGGNRGGDRGGYGRGDRY
jgi:RNA recognition motif-containing protein